MEFKDLAAHLQEGHLDSVGKFTLNESRAEGRFAKQVALQPYLFLGRLLQAANAADASQIYYSTLRNQISVQIVLTDTSPFLAWLDFFAGRLPPEGLIQQYLYEAFGCARALKPKRLLFHVVAPEVTYGVNLLSGKIDENPTAKKVQGLLLEFAPPTRFWSFITGWLSFPRIGRAEHTTEAYLENQFKTPEAFVWLKCCFSPVPVFLNGWQIRFWPGQKVENMVQEHREQLERFPQPFSSFKLVHIKLADRSQAGSSWFQGPCPSQFQPLSALVYDSQSSKPLRFGTDAQQMSGIFATTDWKCTRVLSLSLPSLGQDSSREGESCKVTFVKGYFPSWDVCERQSTGQLICGVWEPARGGPENGFRPTNLSFLELPECLQAEYHQQEDLQQLCCSSFVGLRYGLQPACLVPVKDGLALSAESPPSWSKGSFVVAVEPGLKVDQNGIKAVKDGVYEEFVSSCEEQLNRLLEEGRYPKSPSPSTD